MTREWLNGKNTDSQKPAKDSSIPRDNTKDLGFSFCRGGFETRPYIIEIWGRNRRKEIKIIRCGKSNSRTNARRMKLKVDKENDALYFRLDESSIVESEEVQPGVILDFNKEGKVVGIEILNLSRRMSPDQLKTLQFETG